MKPWSKLVLVIFVFALTSLVPAQTASAAAAPVVYCYEGFDIGGAFCAAGCTQPGCECESGWFSSTCCCDSSVE